MLGRKMTDALNLQTNHEFFNARLYLSMAAEKASEAAKTDKPQNKNQS